MNECINFGSDKLITQEECVGKFTYGKQFSFSVRVKPNWFQKKMIKAFFGLKYEDFQEK